MPPPLIGGRSRTEGRAILAALEATAQEPAKPRAIPTPEDFEAVVRSLDKHVAVVEQLRARLIAAGLVDGDTTAEDFLGVLPGIVDYLGTEHRKLAAVEAALESEEVSQPERSALPVWLVKWRTAALESSDATVEEAAERLRSTLSPGRAIVGR